MRIPLLPFSCIIFTIIFGPFVVQRSVSADIAKPHLNATETMALYGDQISFDVFRNGSKIGEHDVHFKKQGPHLFVHSTLDLKIQFLFLTAFSYSYDSRATWSRGKLREIATKVDDDGVAFELSAQRTGDQFQVTHTHGSYQTGTPLYPTNHWNERVVSQRRVLNTLTGLINNVTIAQGQTEMVQTESGIIPAIHFKYAGELENEVWYDSAGRWVKMRFKGKDDTPIDYICRLCQGPKAKSVTH